MDLHKTCLCTAIFIVLFNKAVTVADSIPVSLIDDKQAPLVAMIDMSDMNTNVKTYIDGLLVKSLGESIRQTIKDILADELGQICNTTINNGESIGGLPGNNETEWVPIFVACPGNKRSVYRAWVTPSPINDPLIISPGSCIRDHQRRSIIDHWNRREDLIDQVKVELYKGKHVDAAFVFDGNGSTSTSWFSKERLLQTTYNDLASTTLTNYFSIKGHYTTDRIFFINNIYTGCINDKGWLMVVDSRFRLPAGACSYERLYGHEYPYFMYATNNRAGNYDKEGDFGFADMLVVSVKMSTD